MKKFIFQFVGLILLIFLALLFYKGTLPNIPFLSKPTTYKQLLLSDAKIIVEIADTQDKRSKGLGGRPSLASDEGMLFIFDHEDKYPFWMKGLRFSLDFVWIKGNQVVDILQNIPSPVEGQKDESLPIYESQVPVDKVLEVNAGTVTRLNIKIGDTITLKSP